MSNWPKRFDAHVVVFGYKRSQHLQMTLERLAEAEGASETSVTIFIDGPKDDVDDKGLVQETHRVAERNDYGFASKEVIFAKCNRGLAKSIISGVSTALKSNEKVIVLEDDILVGRGFLRFMNDALHRYKGSNEVLSISGYVAPEIGVEIQNSFGKVSAGFSPRTSSWGWATWRRTWQDAKWAAIKNPTDISNTVWPLDVCGNDMQHMLALQNEKLIDSWAVLWAAHHFIKGGVCLYPSMSFVENIGLDGSGTNCRSTQRFATGSEGFDVDADIKWPTDFSVAPSVLSAFRYVYNRPAGSYVKWPVVRLLKRLGIK